MWLDISNTICKGSDNSMGINVQFVQLYVCFIQPFLSQIHQETVIAVIYLLMTSTQSKHSQLNK